MLRRGGTGVDADVSEALANFPVGVFFDDLAAFERSRNPSLQLARLRLMSRATSIAISSALPDVAGLGLSVTSAFNVKSQPVTFPDVVWIDAR